jgi:hypothetical protein
MTANLYPATTTVPVTLTLILPVPRSRIRSIRVIAVIPLLLLRLLGLRLASIPIGPRVRLVIRHWRGSIVITIVHVWRACSLGLGLGLKVISLLKLAGIIHIGIRARVGHGRRVADRGRRVSHTGRSGVSGQARRTGYHITICHQQG